MQARSLVVIVACLGLLALTGCDSSDQRPSEQGQSERGQSEQGQSDQGRSEQGQSDQGRSEQGQSDGTAEPVGNESQVLVNLCVVDDPAGAPNCAGGEVTNRERSEIERVLQALPEVESFEFQTQQEGYQEAKETYPEYFEGPDPIISVEDWPATYQVTLDDPMEVDGVVSALEGLAGVGSVRHVRGGS